MDKYLQAGAAYERLEREYRKYGSLVVAFDFDGTVHDFHREGLAFSEMISLLGRCRKAGFTLICFTASPDEDYVRSYLRAQEIPFDFVNETPPFISTPMNPKKVYYNILLDDRAGLAEAYDQLNRILLLHEQNTFPL